VTDKERNHRLDGIASGVDDPIRATRTREGSAHAQESFLFDFAFKETIQNLSGVVETPGAVTSNPRGFYSVSPGAMRLTTRRSTPNRPI
jgi:hypothetical protein